MMKITALKSLTAAALAGSLLLSTAHADDEDVKVEKKIMVNVTSDSPAPRVSERHMMFTTNSAEADDGEPRGFLGIESTRADATLREQLGLPRGVGLVVQRVVPDTAAAKVLQKHDILIKLADQLLVSSDQLGVLVSSKAPGTEITLTLVRGGKEQTITLALGERKQRGHQIFEFRGGSGEVEKLHGNLNELKSQLQNLHGNISKEEVQRLLQHVKTEDVSGQAGFSWVGEGDGPVVRMLNVNRGNVVFTDENGLVELKRGDGATVLVVKSTDGKMLFNGPVNTEEQRAALSEAVKSRLEKVEAIRHVDTTPGDEFETDDIDIMLDGKTTAMAPAAGAAHVRVEADSSL